MLAALEREFQGDIAARKARYDEERAALIKGLEVLGRLSRDGAPIADFRQISRSISNGAQPQDVVEGGNHSSRKARDLVRKLALQFGPEFTIRNLIETAGRSSDPAIRALDEMTIHSTVSWFKKHGLVSVVSERKSKHEGAVYRIISPNLRRPAIVSKRNSEFPLRDMIVDAIEAIHPDSFEKHQVFAKTQELHPQFAERIKPDSVSATLNKLAHGKMPLLKILKKGGGSKSHLYAKISNPPQ